MKRNVAIISILLVLVGAAIGVYAADGAKKTDSSNELAKVKKAEYTITVLNAKDGIDFKFVVDAKKYYINLDAPFKIKLESSQIKFEKNKLKKDSITSKKPDEKHPHEVIAHAKCTGSGKADATVRFGFCDDKNCYIRKEKLSFTRK